MSDNQKPSEKVRKPLPDPVGEDGIVRKDERKRPEYDIKDGDGGLTEVGGGHPEERKIV